MINEMRCYIILISIVLIIASCAKSKKETSATINQPSRSISELTKAALENGDTIAYTELSIAYMDSPDPCFLNTALLMANKYDYKLAYMDVFYCLTDYYHQSVDDTLLLNHLDSLTKSMAIEYLKLAADKKEPNAMEVLGHYYMIGKNVPKDVQRGKELLQE